MLRADVLASLRCPETGTALTPVGEEVLRQVNAAIVAGRLRNRAGAKLAEQLDEGLMRAEGDFIYPVIRRIPILLVDEAIPVDQVRN